MSLDQALDDGEPQTATRARAALRAKLVEGIANELAILLGHVGTPIGDTELEQLRRLAEQDEPIEVRWGAGVAMSPARFEADHSVCAGLERIFTEQPKRIAEAGCVTPGAGQLPLESELDSLGATRTQSSARAICEVRRSAASELMPSWTRAASEPPDRYSIAM